MTFLSCSIPQLEELKKEIQNLKESSDEKSVDSALRHVRQLLSRPPSIFDAFATWAALEQLCDVAREKGHDRANRFAVILRQTRPLMGSPTFQPVLLKLVGSDEEVAIAKEIQKAVKQAPGVWPRAPSAPPGPGAPRQLSSVVCFNCGRRGHIARSCWRPQNARKFREGKRM